MRTTAAEQWKPPSGDQVESQRAGVWWDAVRIPAPLGHRVLHLLDEETGAVIDSYGALYWLVEVGTADGWDIRQVSVVRTIANQLGYIPVPPLDTTAGPGAHWQVLPGGDNYLTEAVFLREALRAAILAEQAAQAEVSP